MRAATILLALPLVAAPALAADSPARIKLLLGGAYQLGTEAFSQTISFDQFQETATIANSYSAAKAPGIDIGVQVNVFKHVGFSAAGTLYNRDLDASYEASFPHPLFFGSPRSASGSVSGTQKETAFHLSAVAFRRRGVVDLSAWAGASFYKVEADLVQNVRYSDAYPYDSVTVTSTPTTTTSDSPIGFNVGASADWRFSRRVGFGIQARFTHARAKLAVPNAPAVEVDAGGLKVGAGLRVYLFDLRKPPRPQAAGEPRRPRAPGTTASPSP